MGIPKQCRAKTKSGARCKAYAIGGGDFCLTHAPDRARDRAQRNRKGGLARVIAKVSGAAVQIAEIGDVLKLCNAVLLDTWLQENSAPRSRALLACGELAIKVLQIGELESRVERIESILAAREVGHADTHQEN